LGALNASSLEVCNVSIEDAERIVEKIKIYTVGKKMKTIDVTPG